MIIDFHGIRDILKDIGEYPNDEEIEEYIVQKYESRKTRFREDFKDISIGKIIKLYLVFLTFFILSYFVSYSTYYRIASLVVFIIATVLAGIKFTERTHA